MTNELKLFLWVITALVASGIAEIIWIRCCGIKIGE